MSVCNAQQQGDEMACGRCGLRWEVKDPNPPACLQHERRSRPRSEASAAVSKAFREFAVHGMPALPPAIAPAPTLPPPSVNLDVEAVAWAYGKLQAFGVGAVNEDSALMMDRLNLMLLGS
jgi:hypothetical protein